MTDQVVERWWLRFTGNFPTVPSPCLWGRKSGKAISGFLTREPAGICCAMRLQPGALPEAASAVYVLGAPGAVPAGFEGNRLSGGLWLHDRFAVSDCGASGGGSEIHGAVQPEWWHRAVHFPEGHAFPGFSGGRAYPDLVMLGLIRLLLPRVLLPATTAWEPSIRRQAEGNSGGGQCGDAESFAGGEP